jgi:chromosomal replication initiation ATPase DnaA
MGKAEDFGKVLKVVTELMEVTDQEIIGRSRIPEVVDARWLAICLMKDKGYSTKQISLLIGHPERTINHVISSFTERAKGFPHLGKILAIARQELQE